MAEIIPTDVLTKLSSYELALLLFSAYLHDIGMTPARRKVTLHYGFLLTGNKEGLKPEEVGAFQTWLDSEAQGLVPPLTKNDLTPDDLSRAAQLITHYCRYRHNDWSEEWIRENLSVEKLGTYLDWVDDLVLVCKSHHMGYEDLKRECFSARILGSPRR
jgi:hypothetical protein